MCSINCYTLPANEIINSCKRRFLKHLTFRTPSGSAGDIMFENPSREIAAELRLVDKLDSLTLHSDGISAEKPTTSPHGKRSNMDSLKSDVPVTDNASSGTVLSSPASDLTGTGTSKTPAFSHGRDVVMFDAESAVSSDRRIDINPVSSKTDMLVSSSVLSDADDRCLGDDAGCRQSSSGRTSDRVQELTIVDSGISLDGMPEGETSADASCDVTCDQATHVGSSNDGGFTPSQESVPTRGVVIKQDEGAASDSKLNVPLKAVSHSDLSKTANLKGISEHGCGSPSQALASIQRLSKMQSREACRKPSSSAKKSVSPLDAIWIAMREWKTAATVTFLCGASSGDKDDQSPRKTAEDGRSATRLAPDSAAKLFQKKVNAFYGESYPTEPCEPIVTPSKVGR